MARPLESEQLARYAEAKSARSPFEADWKIAAANVWPVQYSMWNSDTPSALRAPDSTLRRTQFDTTGARSLPKYMAILERLLTPQGQRWHGLQPTNKQLLKSYRVRAYFDEVTDLLFSMRYNPRAQFIRASSEVYASLGTYGTGPVFVGARKPNALYKGKAFKYRSRFMRDIFILENADGEIDTVFFRFWYNVRQFKQMWPNEPLPKQMAAEGAKPTPSETTYWEFIHIVQPRSDHDPQALDPRRFPFVSSYLCVPDQTYVGQEEGYRSMPYLTPRVSTSSGSVYGTSPAMRVIAAMGGANTMKKTNLKQGNLAVDPVILAHDDGILNGEVGLKPGFVNYGGVNRDGRKLIQTLDTAGNFRVGEVLLQDERADIEDAFFVTLFQILQETPEMTATEVIERVAERASLLSPTMGSLQSEYAGPNIEREIDLLDEMHLLPPMPPELVEAAGEYEVVYTSPLAKGMYMEEVSGFARSVEMANSIVQATQDQSHLDHFDFDVAFPEISNYMAVPTRWMMDPDKVAEKRQGRAQQMEQQQVMQNAPALASAAKTAAELQTSGAA